MRVQGDDPGVPAERERLDRSHISSGNRLLTRAIAEWTYAQVDENGDPRYSGIRYCSKFESAECWAIFAGTTIIQQWAEPIEPGHPALEEAARDFGITVH